MMPQPPTLPPAGPTPTGEESGRSVRVHLPMQPVRLTYVLLGLIIAVFLAQLASIFFLGDDYIEVWGAKVNSLIVQGEWWRLVTPIFIHSSANILHIVFNAYALYILGREVETFYGSLRFLIIFFIAGISGSIASLFLNRYASVGASGAIFGLIGAEGVFLYLNRRILGERSRRALQNVIGLIVLNLLIGLQGGIDNWAHLGGLIGGAALSWFIGPRWAPPEILFGAEITLEDRQPLAGARWLVVAAFVFGLIGLTGIAVVFPR